MHWKGHQSSISLVVFKTTLYRYVTSATNDISLEVKNAFRGPEVKEL
jgi:hypothetical protein